MENIDSKYYDGFEGYPEIHFICKTTEQVNKLVIWEGYFDEIMRLIKPVDGYWTSLAYYYHMLLGWEEEDGPWRVENPKEALNQFRTIDKALLESITAQVFEEICTLVEDGIKKEGVIFIERD